MIASSGSSTGSSAGAFSNVMTSRTPGWARASCESTEAISPWAIVAATGTT
jgi:hypothetical protein